MKQLIMASVALMFTTPAFFFAGVGVAGGNVSLSQAVGALFFVKVAQAIAAAAVK